MDAESMPPDVRIKTLEPVLFAGRIVGAGETLDVSPTTARCLIDIGAAVREDGQPTAPFANTSRNPRKRLSDLLGG